MELEELKRAIEAILFAAGERIELQRLCAVLETDPDEVEALSAWIADNYPDVEFYTVDGGQDVYPYIFVTE